MNGHFRKRGTSWSFVLDIGIDPKTGKRKQMEKGGFPTKKAAQAAAAEIVLQVENKKFKKQEKKSLETYLKEWLVTKKLSLRASTYSSYKHQVEGHIIPALGKIDIADLTPSEIGAMYAELLTDKNLSESTVRDVHKVLTAALNNAVSIGLIDINPATKSEKPKAERKELSVWDSEQAKAFLEVAKEHREYMAFLLALSTGMRQGEILGLRWKDIDFKEGLIRVVQTLSHNGKALTAGAKTKAGNRVISIDESLVRELQKHKKVLTAERLKSGGNYSDMDLVVPTRKGTPITPRNLSRTYYTLLEQAKVPAITFHDLRHTHATLLLTQGVHPKVVAERLGHADMRTTLEIYSHVLPNMQKDAANKVGQLLFGS